MSIAEMEKRLTAVEQKLDALQTHATGSTAGHPIQSLQRIHATFENDDAFQEAMRLGRQWRQSESKPPRSGKPKAKRK